MSKRVRIFGYSLCQYSSSLLAYCKGLYDCFVIPELEGLFESLNTTSWSSWRSPVTWHWLSTPSQLHSINKADLRLTTSQTLRLNSPLKNLPTSRKPQTSLQSPSKLSTDFLWALEVDICQPESGYFDTLLASTASHFLLTARLECLFCYSWAWRPVWELQHHVLIVLKVSSHLTFTHNSITTTQHQQSWS